MRFTALVATAAACFTSAAADLNFLTVGDWGSNGAGQSAVAATMGKFKPAPSFILALGDNFYEDGVSSTTDPQWKSTFQDIYTGSALDVPWYVLLGNHDYHQNATAQVANTGKVDRWNMPSKYYTFTKQVSAKSTLQIVMLDTVALAYNTALGHAQEEVARGTSTPAALRALQMAGAEELTADARTEQLEWLEKTLASSTADWLLVAGHYPVFTGGYHRDTPELNTDVLPMLKKYGVNAYLCGHDHSLQHLVEHPELPLDSQALHFYLSGSGSKVDEEIVSTAHTVFHKPANGFMHHAMSDEAMTVNILDASGSLLHSYTQQRTRPASSTNAEMPVVA